MNAIQEETGQPINKKNAQSLYFKYMTLALEARTKRKDRVLFEDYYQRAEYYLHLMNKLEEGLPISPTQVPEPHHKGQYYLPGKLFCTANGEGNGVCGTSL